MRKILLAGVMLSAASHIDASHNHAHMQRFIGVIPYEELLELHQLYRAILLARSPRLAFPPPHEDLVIIYQAAQRQAVPAPAPIPLPVTSATPSAVMPPAKKQ